MISKLDYPHLMDAMKIIKKSIVRMRNFRIDQWDSVYPNLDILRADIESGNAYGYLEDDELWAYFVLDEKQLPEYFNLKWKITDGKQLVVHRLVVEPVHQGKGIAQACMIFAEQYAMQNGYRSIRLDAFAENKQALSVYNKLCYEKIGTINLRKGLFFCYEKEIIPD